MIEVELRVLLLYNDIKSGQNDAKNTEGKQRMKKARNELLQFLGGLAMLIGGLFLFSQKVMVSSGFGMGFLLGYEWVIMLVLIFGGAGLLAKILLTNPEEDYGYHSRKKNRGNSYSDSIDKQIEEMKRRRK